MTTGPSADRKALIIGLDGATFDVMDPLLAAGQLPNLGRLMHEGAWGRLRSTLPPNSAPAWTAFLTGKNPGHHGLLNFRYLDPSTYSGYSSPFASTVAFVGQTFLDGLGQAGKGVVAHGVPMTYPAWSVRGVMVSGYPTPDRKRAYTYPLQLSEEMGRIALHHHDELFGASPAEEQRNVDFEVNLRSRQAESTAAPAKGMRRDAARYSRRCPPWPTRATRAALVAHPLQRRLPDTGRANLAR